MNAIVDVFLLASAVLHVVIIAYILFNRQPARQSPGWLLGAALCTWAANVLLIVPLPELNTGIITIVLLALAFVTYGQYVIRDVLQGSRWFWWGIGAVWLAAIGVLFVAAENTAGIAALAGLGLMALLLVGVEFYAFYKATLPEAANRALFWVLVSVIMAAGIALFMSGTGILMLAGVMLILVALFNATYAHLSYRVFDMRGAVLIAIRSFVMLLLAAGTIFAALLISERLDNSWLTWLVLAVVSGTLFLLASQIIRLVLPPVFVPPVDPTTAARQYSQQISMAVELDELIRVATATLNRVLKTRGSGVLLVNDTSADNNSVEVIAIREDGRKQDSRGYISKDGPVYEQLADHKLALTQFDIDFDPRYRALVSRESSFFSGLQMSAYAPIIVENALVGVLMCGPKLNDSPFYKRDLDLLSVMADQTGIALRNSRSLADLKHLNSTMQMLNDGLEDANRQYEKLDAVKTDFITIASHELRTPLAQIRGYVDIIDALNEQGMLDQDQTTGMVNNLRRAIERTEELIAAMLDMSQLDVNAMDLRFAEASPEAVVRMAIEPLTEHIKQRKLTLSARGLRGLPSIHCDMQRLVQAFRNVVTNAIKFTPDGGRIDITASFQSSGVLPEDHVLVAISDTGVGIDVDNLELIFEKFYRASDPNLHSTGSYKFLGAGPGLGLTIARGVIESHGGKIWAESSGHNMETCPGSTFYVVLPLTPPDDSRRVLIDDPTLVRDPSPTPAHRPDA